MARSLTVPSGIGTNDFADSGTRQPSPASYAATAWFIKFRDCSACMAFSSNRKRRFSMPFTTPCNWSSRPLSSVAMDGLRTMLCRTTESHCCDCEYVDSSSPAAPARTEYTVSWNDLISCLVFNSTSRSFAACSRIACWRCWSFACSKARSRVWRCSVNSGLFKASRN